MPTSVPLSSVSQAIGRPRDEGGSRDSRGFPTVADSDLGARSLPRTQDVPGVGPAHHQFKHRLSPYPPLPETRSTILPTLRLAPRSA